MKDYVLQLAAAKSGLNEKLNAMREYLQAYLLRILHDHGFFRTSAFLGGTALRLMYQLPRFSEDLDFSKVQEPQYSFTELVGIIKRELTLAGYSVAINYKDQKTVQYAMIKFERLLYEAGLSPLSAQKFSVKIEIDVNPPQGAILETQVMTRYFPLSFISYDVPSLFAGKITALLCRKYTKGRDFFDLGWYLSRWQGLVPNFKLLQNGLKQVGYKKEPPSEGNWRQYLYQIVEQADWKKVTEDVEKFLENPSDLHILSKENLLHLLK